jgi:HAE1 family hydrophobic/amphiphilic exporter-1
LWAPRLVGRFLRLLGRGLGALARGTGRAVWILLWPIRVPAWLMLNGFLWPVLVRPLLRGVRWLLRAVRWLILTLVWLLRKAVTGLLNGFMRLAHAALFPVFDALYGRLQSAYVPLLDRALERRGTVLATTFVLFFASMALVPRVGLELIPQFTQGEFTFETQLPDGTPLQVNDAIMANIERDLEQDPRIETFFVDVGGVDRLGANKNAKKQNLTQINVILRDRSDQQAENDVVEAIRRRLEAVPDLEFDFRRPSYFSFRTPIEVELYGYNLQHLAEASAILTRRLATVPGLRDVNASLEEGSPEVQIAFNRERVAAMNLDINEISRNLRNKIRGDAATHLKERDRQIDIRVRTAHADEIDIRQVGNLVVSQAEGVPVMLSSVADVSLERGPSQIEHLDQQRAALIRADLAGRDLGSVSQDIEAVLRNTPLPGNVVAGLAGQNDELRASFKSLILAVLLAVFMVYIVMASQFESLLHPFVILGTVPLALIGVILALVVTNTPISVVVFLGVIMLAGIVVNNSIVLIDFVNQLRAQGRSKHDALREAARIRLRPILMTTLTTVLALLPMALGLGEGAEIRTPMAIAVIGGLTLSTLLTLVVIPVLYSVVDRTA